MNTLSISNSFVDPLEKTPRTPSSSSSKETTLAAIFPPPSSLITGLTLQYTLMLPFKSTSSLWSFFLKAISFLYFVTNSLFLSSIPSIRCTICMENKHGISIQTEIAPRTRNPRGRNSSLCKQGTPHLVS